MPLAVEPTTKYDDLPEFLSVEEFQTVTRVSRATAYDLARRLDGVVRYGRTIRIPKSALLKGASA